MKRFFWALLWKIWPFYIKSKCEDGTVLKFKYICMEEHQFTYRQYFCPKCYGVIVPGPSGAGTNQVCHNCKINYGCLPGAQEG